MSIASRLLRVVLNPAPHGGCIERTCHAFSHTRQFGLHPTGIQVHTYECMKLQQLYASTPTLTIQATNAWAATLANNSEAPRDSCSNMGRRTVKSTPPYFLCRTVFHAERMERCLNQAPHYLLEGILLLVIQSSAALSRMCGIVKPNRSSPVLSSSKIL